jgi:hypothetical protein
MDEYVIYGIGFMVGFGTGLMLGLVQLEHKPQSHDEHDNEGSNEKVR